MDDVDPLEGYPKTAVLTDGTHVTLRPGTAGDRERMAAFAAGVGGITMPPTAVVIVALDEERVVGALTIRRDDGSVDVALDPDYRGRRLGTWMLLDAVHLATDLGFGGLVARVAAADVEFRAALDRLDFRSEAVEDDGTVVLRKRLHRGWPGF